MTAIEVLKKARALLVERGWIQGDYCDSEQRCLCSVGAIYVAAGAKLEPESEGNREEPDDPKWTPVSTGDVGRYALGAIEALGVSLSHSLGGWRHPRHVPSWQDERGRTFDEVLAAFDKAIADLEARS